ncbi:MAG: glycosyltransferase family 4 protein, partial [Chloroflexota bacterium]|nr:glycosyltransferase family 4 protein [Chloroflexota bacterium]
PCENPLEKTAPRLLLVTPWMARGGADKVNLDLLPQLRAAGWEITIATTLAGDHSLLPDYAEHTSDLFPLSHFLELVDYPRFLAYLIQSRRPDAVLVSNSELGYRLLPYLRSRCPEPAYVDFCHSEAEHWIHGGYPRLSVEYQELLDLTVTASAHLRSWMTARGGDQERIHVCYANVDAEGIRPDPAARRHVRELLHLDSDVPAILFVGRLSEDKQPDVLAGTMRLLHWRGAPFQLVVAGDGPDLPRLRRFFKRHQLAHRVRLLGNVHPDQLKDVYAAADVVFLPSRSEGIALVLYEAMAAALPVVAARVGGQAELVTPETGVLVPRGAPAEEMTRYADAIAPLLLDAALRERMGSAGRERIEQNFLLEQLGHRMQDLLELAMKMRQDKPRPLPGRGLGRASATEAVELTRANVLADALWNAPADSSGPPTTIRAYLFLQRVGGPAYRWAVAHDVPVLPALRDGLRRRLMGF